MIPLDTDAPPLVFLLSAPRAGSTLVTRIIDSHSALASPCEICVPYVVATSWKLGASLRNILTVEAHYRVASRSPLEWLTSSGACRRLESLGRAILTAERKSVLVVKDPRHASHPRRILSMPFDSPPRFIMLHRDARAVAHSFHTTLGRDPSHGLTLWRAATLGMLELIDSVEPSRVLELRYEDLLDHPPAAAHAITTFLGVPYEPTMLEYGRFAHADDRLALWGNPKLVQSVRRGTIERGNTHAWRADAALHQAYAQRRDARHLNSALGYET